MRLFPIRHGRIIRWGTAMIFSVFLLLILFAWLIKYPDIIPAPIEITTVNPPVTLSTKITGRINKLYVTDGAKVSSGQLLAVMETAASINEINKLKAAIDTVKDPEKLSSDRLPYFSELGELQPYYATFLKAHSDYETYIKNDFYGGKIISISQEIAGLQEYINRMSIKEKLVSDNLTLERRKYQRDSVLFCRQGLFRK